MLAPDPKFRLVIYGMRKFAISADLYITTSRRYKLVCQGVSVNNINKEYDVSTSNPVELHGGESSFPYSPTRTMSMWVTPHTQDAYRPWASF